LIDIDELKTALAQIEQEKIDANIALQAQLKAESDARRTTAINYISTLDFTLKGTTTSEKKIECYTLMDFCKSEIQKATYGELKQELQKKIDELLIQANQLKDLQRQEKAVLLD
jgi:hypothetical protein